jgi:hypothetical protein
MSKLTLNLDGRLVETAKDYARAKKTSLSKLVARFFSSLPHQRGDEFVEDFHRRLLARGFKEAPDRDRELRARHIKRKYL